MAKRQATERENAALLARVSDPGQRDNSSFDSQLARDRQHCAQHGYNIIIEKREVMSGAFVLARSEFNDLLEMAADGLIQVIVVDVPDRLGRGDVIAQCEILATLNGARVEYAQPGRDTSTVEGLIQHSAEQMVSGIERLNIGRRTRDGKYAWAKKGRVIAPPRRPYGYQVVSQYDDRGNKTDCRLEIVEDEKDVVVMMYEWIVYEGLTANQVTARLNQTRVPRLCERDPNHQAHYKTRKKKKSVWSRSVVSRILANPLYRGQWQYGLRKIKRIDSVDGIQRKVTLYDLSNVVVVPVPSIVSDQLWRDAQDQLTENGRKFVKPSKHTYLLRGRVHCAICGRRMAGRTIVRKSGLIHRYYRCPNNPNGHLTGPEACENGVLPAGVAERAVWETVRDVLLHPERLWSGIHSQQAEAAKSIRLLQQSIAAIQVMIDKAEAGQTRLLDLYTDGALEKPAYIAKKQELNDEIDKHQKKTAVLQERLSEQPVIPPETEVTLRRFQQGIANRLTDEVPDEDKQTLYDLLRVECVYKSADREMVITGLWGSNTVPLSSV